MKILQIFPGKVWGGAEQYVLDLGNALTKKGNTVFFVSRRSKSVLERVIKDYNILTLPFASSLDLYSAYCLSLMIRRYEIDVIHVHDTKFVPVAIMARKFASSNAKVIFTRHIARASKVNPLFRIFFAYTDIIIFVSELAKNLWIKANPWMPENKCRAILNSIPPDYSPFEIESYVKGNSLRVKFSIPQNTPLIVFCGRVRKSKGCTVLIEALALIKHIPFHFVFIGRCKPVDYTVKLQAKAKKYGISDRISFYGFSSTVRKLIQEADIGVAPSIVREACNLSVMEFMQAGKSVITSDNGAQCEYVTSGKTGILVPPGDVRALSKALTFLIENKKQRDIIGRNAMDYFASRLNYDKFINRIIECYSL